MAQSSPKGGRSRSSLTSQNPSDPSRSASPLSHQETKRINSVSSRQIRDVFAAGALTEELCLMTVPRTNFKGTQQRDGLGARALRGALFTRSIGRSKWWPCGRAWLVGRVVRLVRRVDEPCGLTYDRSASGTNPPTRPTHLVDDNNDKQRQQQQPQQ